MFSLIRKQNLIYITLNSRWSTVCCTKCELPPSMQEKNKSEPFQSLNVKIMAGNYNFLKQISAYYTFRHIKKWNEIQFANIGWSIKGKGSFTFPETVSVEQSRSVEVKKSKHKVIKMRVGFLNWSKAPRITSRRSFKVFRVFYFLLLSAPSFDCLPRPHNSPAFEYFHLRFLPVD